MVVRIKNLEFEIKGDAKKIEKAMQRAMDTYARDAFVYGGLRGIWPMQEKTSNWE